MEEQCFVTPIHQSEIPTLILIIKPNTCTNFSNLFLGTKLYMFRTVPLSITRSFSLYTQQWYMSYRFADSLRAGSGQNWSWSCSQAVSKPVWHIPLLCVQWKTPDDGKRNCPKHVAVCSKKKNKIWEISVSTWFYYKYLSGCVVTWTSDSHITRQLRYKHTFCQCCVHKKKKCFSIYFCIKINTLNFWSVEFQSSFFCLLWKCLSVAYDVLLFHVPKQKSSNKYCMLSSGFFFFSRARS